MSEPTKCPNCSYSVVFINYKKEKCSCGGSYRDSCDWCYDGEVLIPETYDCYACGKRKEPIVKK